MERNWTSVGEQEVCPPLRDIFLAEVETLEWHRLPCDDAPMMQGEAIKAAITQLRLPKVSRVAWNGVFLNRMAVLGIECQYKNGRCRVYLLDTGTHTLPIFSDFWKSGKGDDGPMAQPAGTVANPSGVPAA